MKVLLVEDNPEIKNSVTLTFKLRWPEATVVSTEEGNKGVDMVETERPDVVILDINLPDITGFEVLGRVRLFSDVPIIILTVRSDEVDELRGLEMRADDYVIKPFSPADLLTRVKAVLRRTGMQNLEEERLPPLVMGSVTINFSTREVFLENQRVQLTPTEYRVLSCLVRSEGKTLPQEVIKQQVWGSEARYIDGSTLKRYIYQLRTKLGDTTDDPKLICNEGDAGYRLVKP